LIPPKWIRYSGEPIDSQSLRREKKNRGLDDDEFFGLTNDAERNDESSRSRRRMAHPEQSHHSLNAKDNFAFERTVRYR